MREEGDSITTWLTTADGPMIFYDFVKKAPITFSFKGRQMLVGKFFEIN